MAEQGRITITAGAVKVPITQPVKYGLTMFAESGNIGPCYGSCIPSAVAGGATTCLIPRLSENPAGDWTPSDHFTTNPDSTALAGSTKNIYVTGGTPGDIVNWKAQ